MEIVKLIGVAIIVLGFALKLDVLAVVLVAGIVTGIVSGLDFFYILEIIGTSFVNNRLMSIFFFFFPVIAIIERFGMKERAAYLIGKIKDASAGKVLSLWIVIRSLASAMNIRIGGHVQFIRPLILPMTTAAAEASKGSRLTEKEDEKVKGLSAASENYGNFFAQNCFPAASGVVLIQSGLAVAGYDVTLSSIASASISVMIISIILTMVQVFLFDRQVKGGKK